jgi:hypothetical protein
MMADASGAAGACADNFTQVRRSKQRSSVHFSEQVNNNRLQTAILLFVSHVQAFRAGSMPSRGRE